MGDLAGKDRNHDDQTSFELVEKSNRIAPCSFCEDFKSGLGFKIGARQQTSRRTPNL